MNTSIDEKPRPLAVLQTPWGPEGLAKAAPNMAGTPASSKSTAEHWKSPPNTKWQTGCACKTTALLNDDLP
eukprot:11186245-Lingulodinium_polyedra.AAC.1